jgi:hypothetical protein
MQGIADREFKSGDQSDGDWSTTKEATQRELLNAGDQTACSAKILALPGMPCMQPGLSSCCSAKYDIR